MVHVVVVGATGLVGGEVVRALAARENARVTCLVRRPGSISQTARVKEVAFDFTSAKDLARLGVDISVDILMCCIGTTLKKAGSEEAFLKVDRDIPAALISQLQAAAPDAIFTVVSSVGADKPVSFYLSVKAQVENVLRASGLGFVIVRPSLLLGRRDEARPAERIAGAVMTPLFGLGAKLTGKAVKSIGRYRPIDARQVAEAMIRLSFEQLGRKPRIIAEGWDLLG